MQGSEEAAASPLHAAREAYLCNIEAHVSFFETLGGLCGEETIQLAALTVFHQEVQVGSCLDGPIKGRHKGMIHCTKTHTMHISTHKRAGSAVDSSAHAKLQQSPCLHQAALDCTMSTAVGRMHEGRLWQCQATMVHYVMHDNISNESPADLGSGCPPP